MNPTASGVHYNQILQNISINYRNSNFIGDLIAPVIPVDFKSDAYYIFSKADSFRDTADYRAPGTSSNRDGFSLSTASYDCREIAQSTQLEDETRTNSDRVLNMQIAKTNFVTNKILLKHEILTEAKLMTTGNWANSSTPTVTWDDYDNSDPIDDIETAIDTVEDSNGYKVNTMVIAKNVWKILKHHPQILAKLSNDTMRVATIQDLKDIFEVERVIIGGASKNTTDYGLTASYSPIWSKDVWVGYVASTPMMEEATSIYTFSWNYSNSPDNRPMGFRGVRTWRDENIHSDIIEAYQSFDMKIVGSDLGYVLEAVIE